MSLEVDLRDAAAVERACRDVEVVYHLAAGQRMKPQFGTLSEQEIFDMNLGGVRHVLDGARATGARKVVLISSSGVYGIPETAPVARGPSAAPARRVRREQDRRGDPLPRAVAKGLDVTVLRPMSLFGRRMTGVFLLLFEWVRRGKNVYLLGAGRNRVQMIERLGRGRRVHAGRRAAGEPRALLNLGSGEVPTVRGQVEALIAHAFSRSRIIAFPASCSGTRRAC